MRPPVLATALAALLFCLAARTSLGQPAALVTVLDSAGVVGGGSDVAYGPNGRALVSYLDATHGALKVAACHDVACTSATLHTIDASGAVTGSTSIAFGADGFARIAYQAGPAVRIARCADAACSTATLATVATVPGGLGQGTAIGIGGDGLPILAYPVASGLRIAHCDDAACGSATITTYSSSSDVTLTIGGDGRALVAASDGLSVRTYHCTNAACTTADQGFIFGLPTGNGWSYLTPSLATRPDGTGLIAVTYSSHYGPPHTQLFACGTASCTNPTSVLVSIADASRAPALDVTADGRVVLAYSGTAPTLSRLQATSCASGPTGCAVRTIDAPGIGRNPRVAVGPAGIGLVSYQNEASGDLRVAYLVDPPTSPIWTTLDSAGDVGRDSDVAFGAEGRGFIAYVDTTNGGLKVAACADLACSAADVRTIDAGGPVASASVAVGADGRPTIAYQHTPTAALRVARCADAACTSAAIVTLDDLGTLTAGTDIAIGADGLPVVVYGDAGTGTLRVAHCEDAGCAARTVTPYPDAALLGDRPPSAVRGADGLVVFGSTHGHDLRIGHCSNAACTAATFTRLSGAAGPPFDLNYRDPALAVGGDGRPVVAYVREESAPPNVHFFEVELRRCVDTACSGLETAFATVAFSNNEAPSVGVAPGDLPVVSNYGQLTPPSPKLKVTRCTTPACPFEVPIVIDGPNIGRDHAMAVDGYGRALVSYYDDPNGDLRVAWLGPPAEISIGDFELLEGSAGSTVALVPVTISAPVFATVAFATAPGTATAPSDYAAITGTLTFSPGTTTHFVTVSVVPDAAIEPDETFFVNLSSPQGAVLADGQGIVTIRNDDPSSVLRIRDISGVEGSPGPGDSFTFSIVLEPIVAHPVLVDFTTVDGTARAGVDYLQAFGTLSFAPGEQSRDVHIDTTWDTQPELDETFFVRLTNAQGALIEDDEGVGTLVNDDEFPIPGELRHGASYVGDLISNDAPAADVDDFRLAQDPYASYEVVVDAVSGDADLTLERRGPGGAVLQSGVPVGTGSAVALRWRTGSTAVTDETVRIAGACSAPCGADDVYRVRMYETTLRAVRFNNTGDQATVLVLSNPGTDPVAITVHFWRPDGTLLTTHTPAGPLAPHGVLIVDTSGLVPEASGSLTVAHDGPYGGLAGKAVALEPSTGFSFDTPFEPRPR